MALMTKAEIVRTCKELGFYSTPELNERLYLHCRGFAEIAGLEEFTGARALYLESNCISEIGGLDHNLELSALYLAKNCITTIGGVSHLNKLDKLDLSDNMIQQVQGLGGLPITTLLLARNSIRSVAGLAGLAECPSIRVLDLSHNRISDEGVVDALEKLPKLSVLKLDGNPVTRTMKTYRKTLTLRLLELKSLDDMPVSALDHLAAEAYFSGGVEAERAVRKQHKEAERAKEEQQRLRFDEMLAARRKERRPGPQQHTEYWMLNHGGAADKQPNADRRVSEELVDSIWEANVPNADGEYGCAAERERDAMRQRTLAAANRPPQGPPRGPPRPRPESPELWSEGSDWQSRDVDSSVASDGEPAEEFRVIKSIDAAIESAWARGDRCEYDRLIKQAGRSEAGGAERCAPPPAERPQRKQRKASHADPAAEAAQPLPTRRPGDSGARPAAGAARDRGARAAPAPPVCSWLLRGASAGDDAVFSLHAASAVAPVCAGPRRRPDAHRDPSLS
eukprot:TRINITY_DN22305_c0_g1_i1.p1 TRINITY_DN22305_c0_g1~~TRINITY_DN22305_c0_g1_i1.p1  ORF type:complete len:536 (+),score=152.53 TRINITY_DN22305_c0_g1_i1:85-1608(+)